MCMTETSATRQNYVTGAQLLAIREKLGLTSGAMASLLYISPMTYRRWEEDGTNSRTWSKLTEQLDRFYVAAINQLEVIEAQGIDMEGLVPIHMASRQLGTPQEVLFHRHRRGELDAVDLGVLGLWIHKDDLEAK